MPSATSCSESGSATKNVSHAVLAAVCSGWPKARWSQSGQLAGSASGVSAG